MIPAGNQALREIAPGMEHVSHAEQSEATAASAAAEPSTAELVARARRGDRDAYGALVTRFAGLVHRRATMWTHDADAAQDIAQETFLIGWEHLDRLRQPDAFGAWLAGIARNEARSWHRRQSRAPASLDEMTEHHHPAAMSAASDPPDRVAAERSAAVARAMQALPPLYREIMLLRHTEDLSYNTLAEFLGVSMSVVKTRLLRGRSLLIKRLKREGHL